MKETKKFLFLVALVIVTILPVWAAETTVGVQDNLETGGLTLDVFTTKSISTETGLFFYALGCEGYAEAYAGATWSPRPFIQLALGYGVEQANPSNRVGGWLWLGEGKLSFIHLFEDGGSGPWHKTELDYQLTPSVKIGLVDKTTWGNGAVVGFRANKMSEVKLYACQHATVLSTSFCF